MGECPASHTTLAHLPPSLCMCPVLRQLHFGLVICERHNALLYALSTHKRAWVAAPLALKERTKRSRRFMGGIIGGCNNNSCNSITSCDGIYGRLRQCSGHWIGDLRQFRVMSWMQSRSPSVISDGGTQLGGRGGNGVELGG